MTLHNAAMQSWIDSGLIGVVITLGFLSAVAGKLVRGKRLAGAPQASAVFSYIILVGAFSTYGTIYWDDGFYARIGRAHVCTPVTNAHLVCRLLLEKKTIATTTTSHTSMLPGSIYI